MKPLRNKWHDPRNVWNIATDSQGKISKASGVYYHNDIMTSFSLLRQPEGRRSAYRGHMEIISQISGNVLVRKYEKDGKYIEKKVRAELNCKDCSEREMKDYIAGIRSVRAGISPCKIPKVIGQKEERTAEST